MRWEPGHKSDDIEDRRGEHEGGGFGGGGGSFGGGGGGGYRGGGGIPVGKLGIGGVLVVVLISVAVNMLSGGGGGGPVATAPSRPVPSRTDRTNRPAPPRRTDAAEERLVQFVSFVLDDVQDTWTRTLPRYERAKLVLFRDRTRSGCGVGERAMGPFYCPADRKVYIDLGFYNELQRRFGAPGDFAQAYVIAHEIGHHVQNLLGHDARLRRMQKQRPSQENALSVRFELQADCLAGVWAHSTRKRDILEEGDIEEGMGAAAAVGDDRIQRQAGARVNPESWTHGSSKQRVWWFKRGLAEGRVEACDTLAQMVP